MGKEEFSGLVNRRWTIVIGSILVLCFSSVGLYLFAWDVSSDREIRRLIEPHYTRRRPEGGRLFGAAYAPIVEPTFGVPDLGRAQLLLLRRPDTDERQRLQGAVYLAAGEWQKFITMAEEFPLQIRNDISTLNNLGVSFLALSERDPSYLLRALDVFERASKANPQSLEPLYNLVITYRRRCPSRVSNANCRRSSAWDRSSAR